MAPVCRFHDVQIVHKFAGWVTPSNLNFKVTIFFNEKYIENDLR